MPVNNSDISYKTSFIKAGDSPVKKFFKDFFNFSNIRYQVLSSKDHKIELEKIAKPHNLAINIFKVALCFTVIVPIIAGISKLIEMRALKNFQFKVIDAKKDDSESEKVPSSTTTAFKSSTTAFKIDSLRAPKPTLQIDTNYASRDEKPIVEKLFETLELVHNKSFETFKTLMDSHKYDFGGKLLDISINSGVGEVDNEIEKAGGCKYIFRKNVGGSDRGTLYLSTSFLSKFKKLDKIFNENNPELSDLLNQVVEQIKIVTADFSPKERNQNSSSFKRK